MGSEAQILQVSSLVVRPKTLRCDNGPEFTSRHFVAWCEEHGIAVLHIQPGRPMQNGHVESFNGRLRDECLNANWFRNLFDARGKIAAWREEYNGERPHSSLGYRTPNEFAEILKSSVMNWLRKSRQVTMGLVPGCSHGRKGDILTGHTVAVGTHQNPLAS